MSHEGNPPPPSDWDQVYWRMSELYLDQDLNQQELVAIARPLAESPFTLQQLEKALFSWVHPVCCRNLQATVGLWSGFDQQQLLAEIHQRQAAPSPEGLTKHLSRLISRYQEWRLRKLMLAEWIEVKIMIRALRIEAGKATDGDP